MSFRCFIDTDGQRCFGLARDYNKATGRLTQAVWQWIGSDYVGTDNYGLVLRAWLTHGARELTPAEFLVECDGEPIAAELRKRMGLPTVECWKPVEIKEWLGGLRVDGAWHDLDSKHREVRQFTKGIDICRPHSGQTKCTLGELLAEYAAYPEIVQRIRELTLPVEVTPEAEPSGVKCYRDGDKWFWVCGPSSRIFISWHEASEFEGQHPRGQPTIPCTLADVLASEPGKKHAANIREFVAKVTAPEPAPAPVEPPVPVNSEEPQRGPRTYRVEFWVVWSHSPRIEPTRHSQLGDAITRCESFAKQYPETEFFILEAKKGYVSQPQPQLVEIELVDEMPF